MRFLSILSCFFTQRVGSNSNHLPATHSGASKIEWELILYSTACVLSYNKNDKKCDVLYKISPYSILEAPEYVAGRLVELEPNLCVKTQQNW